MLGAEATVHGDGQIMDQRRDALALGQERRPRDANRLAEVEVNIAVADVTKGADPQTGHRCLHPRARLFHELGDAAHRHGDIVLQAHALGLLRFGDALANAPELGALGGVLRDGRVVDQSGVAALGK